MSRVLVAAVVNSSNVTGNNDLLSGGQLSLEQYASSECVQRSDYKGEKQKEMMHVNSKRTTIEELVGRG